MQPLAVKKVEVPKGHIRDRIHTCLADKLVGIPRPYTRGSKSLVHSSLLRIQGGIVPVVIKFWDLGEFPPPVGAVALNVHNAHVTLNKLRETGEISTIIVPRIYASFLELEDGTLLELPPEMYVISKTTQERKDVSGTITQPAGFGISNQLIIVDDLSRRDNPKWVRSRKDSDRYRLIDRSDKRRGWPTFEEEIDCGMRRDILVIARHMPLSNVVSKEGDIASSLVAIDRHPDGNPRYLPATIDFDKFGKVICGGVQIVNMDQFLE